MNSRVVCFNSTGKYLSQFGQKGTDPGEFKSPLGMSIDSEGRIYIADSKNHRIQIIDQEGKAISEVYIPPDKYGCLADPTDIVIDEKKQHYIIVDNDNHRLLLYNKKLELIREIGGVGYEEGNFRYPYTACIDGEGNIYVTDVINTRVQVFNSEGDYIRSLGEWGIEKGQFFRPQSICMDKKERVLVGENYAKIGLIQVFDSQGNLLGIIGDSQGKKLRFKVPADLYVDQQNRLYVVQMFSSTISVFSFIN